MRLFHYMVISKVCQNFAGLEVVATEASVSLFRFADLIPANRAIYEAGKNAKTVGWVNLAFVLLNRFLDIGDMIEENGDSADATLLDNTDFKQTDVPNDKLCIPVRPCVNGQLPLDERGVYEACLINWKKSSDPPATPCVLTGYPVFNSRLNSRHKGKKQIEKIGTVFS
uniref:Uncharacterized protein n=1 Tax=Daphnia galeata TaxID=27404 RepID=A0A8J2W5H9_9CRUS|nr:unnamed protein product [Daphnia galeata]